LLSECDSDPTFPYFKDDDPNGCCPLTLQRKRHISINE
jgi:hypothetical protein